MNKDTHIQESSQNDVDKDIAKLKGQLKVYSTKWTEDLANLINKEEGLKGDDVVQRSTIYNIGNNIIRTNHWKNKFLVHGYTLLETYKEEAEQAKQVRDNLKSA